MPTLEISDPEDAALLFYAPTKEGGVYFEIRDAVTGRAIGHVALSRSRMLGMHHDLSRMLYGSIGARAASWLRWWARE